jgi:hypothetical protein
VKAKQTVIVKSPVSFEGSGPADADAVHQAMTGLHTFTVHWGSEPPVSVQATDEADAWLQFCHLRKLPAEGN